MARWALLSAPKGQNKSDVAKDLVARLQARRVRAAGFLQERHYDAAGRKGYELVRIATGERLTLARGGVAARGPSEEAHCFFAFSKEAFERARRWLVEDARQAELLVVDGVSILETRGRGHAKSMAWALAQPEKIVLLCVGARQLFYIVENFGLDVDPVDALELPAGTQDQERFVESLAAAAVRRVARR